MYQDCSLHMCVNNNIDTKRLKLNRYNNKFDTLVKVILN